MEMVDMAIKPSQADSLYACSPAPSCSPYPYGLRLNLNQDQLNALGIKDLPPAGTTLNLQAVAVITRSSTEDPDADGDVDYVCVEMQVTQLGLEEAGESDDEEEDAEDVSVGRAERMYAKGKQPA